MISQLVLGLPVFQRAAYYQRYWSIFLEASAWHYYYPGSFSRYAERQEETFNMALPVPKTMFQHMLKEGAKVFLVLW